MRVSFAPLVFVLATQLPPVASPPRDAGPRDASAAPAGTSIIRGRVTDAESGRPMARVMVMLIPGSFGTLPDDSGPTRNGRAMEPRITLTGFDGRYEYKQVAAGAYYVSFDPSEFSGSHLPQNFGETGPANPFAARKLPTLVLKDGEVRGDVNAVLVRALAIEGRVVDEQGEPISNVQVGAHAWEGPEHYAGRPRSTDDRGAFRLFGLRPGQYRICAKPELHFGPSEEIRDRLMRTCYPAAIAESNAEPVRVDSSDVVGIDIRVQRGRAYKITGTALDSSGTPIDRPQVNLVTIGKMGSSSSGITSLPGGQFRAQAVTPGEYAILVEIGSRYNPEDKRERELGYLPLSVDNADVEGIVVTTAKLAKVAGRIIFDDGLPETLSEKVKVTAGTRMTPSSPMMMIGPPQSAEVRDDFTFELSGLFGPQTIAVTGQPRGWIVKSVKYRGEEVTDMPVEFKTSTDPRALEIVLTRRVALVSGRVLDDDGKPAEEGFVVLVPADAARRKAGSHVLKFATLKPGGAFSLGPVRAGEYIIAAQSGTPMQIAALSFAANSAEKLERIAALGERILLVENEQKTMDLRVVKAQ